jgi:hypothetical protein
MTKTDHDGSSFFPQGAIAFFVFMIVFYAGFWFAMFALMAARG